MNVFWLLRAKRWAQNPPSAKRVMLVLGIVALCLAIAGAEYLLGGGGDAVIPRPNLRAPTF